MSLLEVGNAFFRGELRGATGNMKLKLTADAIDVIDTLNFQGQAVTFNYTFQANGVYAPGNSLVSGTIYVPDTNVYIEIVASAEGGSVVYINGGARTNRNLRGPGGRILPFVELIPVAPGYYTIDVRSGSVGTTPSWAYINVRYIRRTGFDNL